MQIEAGAQDVGWGEDGGEWEEVKDEKTGQQPEDESGRDDDRESDQGAERSAERSATAECSSDKVRREPPGERSRGVIPGGGRLGMGCRIGEVEAFGKRVGEARSERGEVSGLAAEGHRGGVAAGEG